VDILYIQLYSGYFIYSTVQWIYYLFNCTVRYIMYSTVQWIFYQFNCTVRYIMYSTVQWIFYLFNCRVRYIMYSTVQWIFYLFNCIVAISSVQLLSGYITYSTVQRISIYKFGLSVVLYPINVKTADPIGPKFFVGHLQTPGKVYE